MARDQSGQDLDMYENQLSGSRPNAGWGPDMYESRLSISGPNAGWELAKAKY